MTALAKKTRRKLRFAPDPSQHAEIDFNLNRKNFEGELPALIFNESYSGCCVVMMKEKRLKVADTSKSRLAFWLHSWVKFGGSMSSMTIL